MWLWAEKLLKLKRLKIMHNKISINHFGHMHIQSKMKPPRERERKGEEEPKIKCLLSKVQIFKIQVIFLFDEFNTCHAEDKNSLWGIMMTTMRNESIIFMAIL